MDDWAREIEHPASQQDETRRCLTTVAFESQRERIAALEAAGYRRTAHCSRLYRRDLSDAVEVPATQGRLRAVTSADLDTRVDAHRAAWLGSSWDLGRYRAVRSSPVYRASLDIVLDVDRTFASYCICWADEQSKLGLFEPVGTRPEWRGKGAGRAVILEGLRRLRDAGMQTAQVGTAGFNAPAQALYESCGFIPHDTARTFMKVIE
jgi:GNAT superfamily N-acetyltransferase